MVELATEWGRATGPARVMERRTMRRSTRTTRAFTLIELMVVISIIALLMSILLPALSQAREASKTVQCLSNMRQIGIAVSAYATDEDSLPLMDRVTGSGWSTSQQYRLAPYLGGDQNSMWGGRIVGLAWRRMRQIE